MTAIKALDSKIGIGMFLKGMAQNFQGILAQQLSPEQKLDLITQELNNQVAIKRDAARSTGAQMNAAAATLATLNGRRASLVALGGKNLGDQARLASIQTEIKSIEPMIASAQTTYDGFKEAYDLNKANYLQAMDALDKVKNQGGAVLAAIKANQSALAARDNARSNSSHVDTSFVDQLTEELGQARGQLATDKELDADLNSHDSFSINSELDKAHAADVDAGIMAEFEAAAGKTAAAA